MKISVFLFCLSSIMLLTSCSHPAAKVETPPFNGVTAYNEFKTVVAGQIVTLTHPILLNPDCTVRGFAALRVVTPPSHGQIDIGRRPDYPNFPARNSRSACNKKKSLGSYADYMPDDGFVGQDLVTIESISPSGEDRLLKITITVK